MRILSVDDSPTIRSVIKSTVEVLGIDFLEAENGKEALDILEEYDGKIDLILLDWEMSEMNGMEFLKKAKENEKYRSIPVIMLTSVVMKEKMIEAIRAGAKQYITKPFTSEEVLTKLVQSLGMDSLEEI